MTKTKRTIIFGLLIMVLASISSYLVVVHFSSYANDDDKKFMIVWLSSLIPTAIASSISAFLYHYLCESKKNWVHILWFLLNLIFIVAFAPFLAFVILSSMLN